MALPRVGSSIPPTSLPHPSLGSRLPPLSSITFSPGTSGTCPTEAFSHLPLGLAAGFHAPGPRTVELERRSLVSGLAQHSSTRPPTGGARLPGTPSYRTPLQRPSDAQIISSDYGSCGSDDGIIDASEAATSRIGGRGSGLIPDSHVASRSTLSRDATFHTTRDAVVTSSDFGSWGSDGDMINATDSISAMLHNTHGQNRTPNTESVSDNLPKPRALPVPPIEAATSEYGSWGSDSEMITATDVASASRNLEQDSKLSLVSGSRIREALAPSVSALDAVMRAPATQFTLSSSK